MPWKYLSVLSHTRSSSENKNNNFVTCVEHKLLNTCLATDMKLYSWEFWSWDLKKVKQSGPVNSGNWMIVTKGKNITTHSQRPTMYEKLIKSCDLGSNSWLMGKIPVRSWFRPKCQPATQTASVLKKWFSDVTEISTWISFTWSV